MIIEVLIWGVFKLGLKKATLLFDEEVYEKLREKSVNSNISMGELVREAVASYYGIKNKEEKTKALHNLKSMNLPIGSPEEIEEQIISPRIFKKD
jgi:hypothetical protein